MFLITCAAPAVAEEHDDHRHSDSSEPVIVPLGSQTKQRFRGEMHSWQQLHETNVVMQKRDYSCGAAALATIGRYYFRDPVSEQQILDIILKDLSRNEIKDRQDNGLSMDDLFRASEKLGYQAAVAKVSSQKLYELEAPVIVRLIKDDYKHFVVLRGVVGDRIWLADPIRGNVRIPVDEFLRQWNGAALFLGKERFGLPADHALAVGHQRRSELQPYVGPSRPPRYFRAYRTAIN